MQSDQTEVLKRPSYIEGHLKGIRRMVEEDRYCVDILKQTAAVKGALDTPAELNELFAMSRR